MTDVAFLDSLRSPLKLDGDLSIELLWRGNAFLGLGAVSHGGMMLRSGRRPMFVEIRNPWGVELLTPDVDAGQMLVDRTPGR